MKDIIIVGGGVIGTSIARELSKYKLNTVLVEKYDDVASGVSKANSGIVHAGYNEKLGTLKGKLNILGNEMFDELSKDLDFPFKRNGALILAFSEDDMVKLKELKLNGEMLGVKGLEILRREEILSLENNVSEKVLGALYAKTFGIVSPYEMVIALAENANINGVEFKFNTEVINIEKICDGYKVTLSNGEYLESKCVINAAGINGDIINNMINDHQYKIKGVKGEYILFDKIAGRLVKKTLFQVPDKISKGVLVTPTIDGNLMIGPNAHKGDKIDIKTTKEGLGEVIDKAKRSVSELPLNRIITTFVGVRPCLKSDFIIEEVKCAKNFINVIGIDSPGLTAAPAIGMYVKDLIKDSFNLIPKDNFISTRRGIIKFDKLGMAEKNELIKRDCNYGKIVCKCELITEGEIIDAINRPLGARSVDAVKRRTRATMGGCQGVGCLIPISKIIARELNIDISEVMKNKKGSNMIGYKEA